MQTNTQKTNAIDAEPSPPKEGRMSDKHNTNVSILRRAMMTIPKFEIDVDRNRDQFRTVSLAGGRMVEADDIKAEMRSAIGNAIASGDDPASAALKVLAEYEYPEGAAIFLPDSFNLSDANVRKLLEPGNLTFLYRQIIQSIQQEGDS